MCMCGRPIVNGEQGYSWDGKSFGVCPPNPPAILSTDVLLFDEPGRCGGLDSHSHHFRVVKAGASYALLVRHGGGDERINLGGRPGVKAMACLDSNALYWLLQMLYEVQSDSRSKGRDTERQKWLKAASEKRIKTRKQRGAVKVWIEESAAAID